MATTLNLGILAHIDAGKTSLTERLLYTAGAIPEMGRVDQGNTQTDSLTLERRRGITIKSAVVSFVVGHTTINLIDTPGHPDFIAEVERVLHVLDGAVLVISAVEGVQAQTRVLMRTLRRLRIPTLIFVNKIDRRGAHCDDVLHEISEKLTPTVVAMGGVVAAGSPTARCTPYEDGDRNFTTRLTEVLAEHDDALLTTYLDDEQTIAYDRLRRELAAQTEQMLVHPIFFGSAITGAGVAELVTGITELLPGTEGNIAGPVSGRVFKIERGQAGEKVAYARLFSGTVHTRDELQFGTSAGKVTALSVFEHGSSVQRPALTAGQIGKLWGLGAVRVGDIIGTQTSAQLSQRIFGPPTLETVVTSVRPADKGKLHAALTQLAEQDPLMNFRQEDLRHEFSVSMYGEVQKEVIQATLADDFDVDVTFRETTTICIERPSGIGSSLEIISTEANPFLATVGLRIEPGASNSGVQFRLEVELGSMPMAFITAVEETARQTLAEGIHGWRVTDCVVTMTHSGYWARQSHAHGTFDKSMSSTAGDFKNLTPLVLMDALCEAGTTVYEPIDRFYVEIPTDTYGSLLAALVPLRAVPTVSTLQDRSYRIEGDIPAANLRALAQQLPDLTRGEGMLESAFDHYSPVVGGPPSRARTDRNPLDRKKYLLRVARRLDRRAGSDS